MSALLALLLAVDPHVALTQLGREAWNDGNGLPQNSVRGLAQDDAGFLWLGTEEGLVRFDGVRFERFDKRSFPGLGSSMVLSLARQGDVLWLGTEKAGLCRVASGTARCVPLGPAPQAFVDGLVLHDGAPWVIAGRALWVVREGSAEAAPPFDGAPTALASQGNVLWVGTTAGLVALEGGVARRVGEALPVEAIGAGTDGALWVAHPGVLVHRRGEVELSRYPLEARAVVLMEDRQGALWVGGPLGLGRLVDGRFEWLRSANTSGAFSVVTLLEDFEGSLWVGTATEGVTRLRTQRMTAFGAPEGLGGEYVTSVAAGAAGEVWAGAWRGGLDHLTWSDAGVRSVRHLGLAQGLPNDTVWALAAARDGRVWVGTAEGLAVVDGARAVRHDALHGVVHVVAIAADDAVWAGGGGGLVRIAADGGVQRYLDAGAEPEPNTLLMLGDGGVWLGTSRGLQRLEGERFVPVTGDATLDDARISSMVETSPGTVWVGTSSSGLFRWKQGALARLGMEHGLPDDTAFTVQPDGHGSLWTTCNLGVFRTSLAELEAVADGRAPHVSVEAFDMHDGMRSRECNASGAPSTRDAQGRLWFPTLRGLVRIDPAQGPMNGVPPTVSVTQVLVDGRVVPLGEVLEVGAGARQVELHYTAASLRQPERVRFEYQLEGVDVAPVAAGTRRTAYFSNLPPGPLRFSVQAVNDSGVRSVAPAVVQLWVRPRFTQTVWFPVTVALSVLVVAALGFWVRVRALRARQVVLERVVRERTAELATRNQELDGALATLRSTQSELVQAERMASVAVLVQGIAHELNNPLNFIAANLAPLARYVTFLSDAAASLSDGKPRTADELAALTRLTPKKDLGFVRKDVEALLGDLAEGARRAKLIVGDLQGLTQGARRALVMVDVEKVLAQTVTLLRPRVGPGVQVVVEVQPMPPLEARAGHLEQLAMNVVDNALRAVGERGTVRVRARPERDGVRLEVSDDGPGMPEDVRRRATEPFFTTRTAGDGSGLGLAIVASIVEQQHGTLELESAVGRGTTVKVWLPRQVDRKV